MHKIDGLPEGIHATDLAGLSIRIGKNRKTFQLVLGSGKSRKRITLGHYPHLTLQAAKKKATQLIGTHLSQDTPQIGTAEALERFLEHQARKNKAVSVKETSRLLKRHLLFVGKLADLTKGRLVEILDAIEAPMERRHFYTACFTFLRWARRYDLPNRLEGVEKPPNNAPRARLLSDEEMVKVWAQSLLGGSYGLICRCLIVSGQRVSQIAHLHAKHVNREGRTITWPAALMKSGQEHTIPYGPLLHSLLPQGDGVLFDAEGYPSWTAPHEQLVNGLPHFTRHDFRRYFSSTHAALGTPLHVTEKLLGHTSGVISGVAAVYNRYSFMEEMKKAVTLYEQHLYTLLGT